MEMHLENHKASSAGSCFLYVLHEMSARLRESRWTAWQDSREMQSHTNQLLTMEENETEAVDDQLQELDFLARQTEETMMQCWLLTCHHRIAGGHAMMVKPQLARDHQQGRIVPLAPHRHRVRTRMASGRHSEDPAFLLTT